MMYQNNIAAALKVNGKIVRDDKETAYLPFGTEYSVYIKNLNSVRALVKVEIDGVDATGGTRIIIPANGSIELERFIENGNFERGLKFKFIERTSKIENGPRGVKVEDGLIRIEVEFEVQPIKQYNPYRSLIGTNIVKGIGGFGTGGDELFCSNATYSVSDASLNSITSNAAYYSNSADSATAASLNAKRSKKLSNSATQQLNEVGITVGGSVSEQKFVQGSWFPTDGIKNVLVMKVLGEVGQKPVTKVITPKTKSECPTCGTGNKFGNKFCRECGTGLIKV